MTETVVLLHGTGRTPRSLAALEKRLRAEGYETRNLAYPWRKRDVAGLAQYVAEQLADHEGPMHFVTHSMGGLVAAMLLARSPLKAGRVVMLGPPLGGSEVADALSGLPFYRWLYGPAGQDLTTIRGLLDGVRPDYELGVIAGTAGWFYPSGILFIRGPHDGRVSVARTQLDGVGDHLVLPVSHSFMPGNAEVHRQVVHFLKTGAFERK